ncbi:MAG TPA: patatin-like phospholipase family protein [Thermoanaerobaculia bacterium]|nr:patatin-like phospholipase family protein [Thermoanaerobaculia bacterium]
MLSLLRGARQIGFLFSGGSSRCIFQVGVVETLRELGIVPSMCLGVSGGVWNAAAVAVGNAHRLRHYWRCFTRMPSIDLTNLLREHSPFRWSRLHERSFGRYVGNARIKSPETLPLFVAVTRLRDRMNVVLDARAASDPFRLLLASNYLPPFYTHTPDVEGERYADGGFTNNIPYEALFERGCDAVVLMASKGVSEGGLHRHMRDAEHVIPAEFADRIVVIRPRHRLPIRFVERRVEKLAPIADLGRLRAREVLLGESHPETELLTAPGPAPSAYYSKLRRMLSSSRPTSSSVE